MGQPVRGYKLADLNEDQQRFIAAYWLLCDSCPPSKDEDLPLEYAPALNELSRISGKYPRSQHSRRGYKMRGNRGRQVRHSKASGALATSLGGK